MTFDVRLWCNTCNEVIGVVTEVLPGPVDLQRVSRAMSRHNLEKGHRG